MVGAQQRLARALSLSLMDVVSFAWDREVAVPIVSVFAFLPFLAVPLTVSVSLPAHFVVPAQASLTTAHRCSER